MLLTIAILSAIGYLLSVADHIQKGKLDVNLMLAAILVISTWNCLPIAIITIVITVIIGVVGSNINEK